MSCHLGMRILMGQQIALFKSRQVKARMKQ
jgi:hypothetical protein